MGGKGASGGRGERWWRGAHTANVCCCLETLDTKQVYTEEELQRFEAELRDKEEELRRKKEKLHEEQELLQERGRALEAQRREYQQVMNE